MAEALDCESDGGPQALPAESVQRLRWACSVQGFAGL